MSLRAQLISSFNHATEPTAPKELHERSLVAFAARSTLGLVHFSDLIIKGARFVLVVDDYCLEDKWQGIPVVTSIEFLARKSEFHNAVGIDFSQSNYTQGFYKELAYRAGCECRDLLQLLACFDALSVYQSISVYRAQTLARADDWLKLANRLADNQSRETLYGLLLQRLEYDRRWIKNISMSGRDEYFGLSLETTTFALGQREHFVDCGAHRGTIIQKLLQTTGWKYASINAFEPDTENFAALNNLIPWPLEHFYTHKLAVSDKTEMLRFNDTGTMGSSVVETGSTTIQCVAIDNFVEKASFIKLDVEGFEARALKGAGQLIAKQRPRLAVASYHYATDLLDIAQTIDELAPNYNFYLRHHLCYFYDTILYATPRQDWLPLTEAV